MSDFTIKPTPLPLETGDHLRKDTGKSRVDLIPPEVLLALGDLYAAGAAKYAERGWEEGMSWSRCYGPLLRHAFKWKKGEDFDEEMGSHHMINVIWNAIALYTYHLRGLGKDDRK